jgi:hypothetical protein
MTLGVLEREEFLVLSLENSCKTTPNRLEY